MADTISYQYAAPSALQRSADQDELFLAKYSEIEKKDAPCFFWGKLTQPYMTARCLIALSNVVQSSFNLTPAQLSMLKDPIVTAGNNRLRFEGFSNCAGVYARVDVLPDGHDGEFLENGTTNVDFNAGMISALWSIGRQEKVVMSVGPKEVGLYNKGEKVRRRLRSCTNSRRRHLDGKFFACLCPKNLKYTKYSCVFGALTGGCARRRVQRATAAGGFWRVGKMSSPICLPRRLVQLLIYWNNWCR